MPPAPADTPTTGSLFDQQREILTVTRLNSEARRLLEGHFGRLWVEGEVSNFTRAASGHWYFSLKDAAAQVRCAMFARDNGAVGFTPADGEHIVVRGRVSLYEARGSYQLIADQIEAAGAGALQRAFEELKQRLTKEGLFDSAHKQPLPALPRRIGVITSPTGAAIRDILQILRRRFAAVPVLIYPVPVQGSDAGARIASMIGTAGQRAECDVLILARGGGSLEDLWAFNEEAVARAIHACPIPVISGVGHETDVTIADFAADVRAPTPSGAAELAVPDAAAWHQNLSRQAHRLLAAQKQILARHGERITFVARRLKVAHPGQRLQQRAQRLDEIEGRLRRGTLAYIGTAGARLTELVGQLRQHTPAHRVARLATGQATLTQRLCAAARRTIELRTQRLTNAARTLTAVGPPATLERGYAIVTAPDGSIVRDVRTLPAHADIEARVAHGRLRARVTDTRED